jgi:multiple sugar transport system substrate-binding protein
MKVKKLLSILMVILVSTTILTAQGSKENSTKADELEINFWHHYSGESAENKTLNNVLIPEFEKLNPGIKVNAVSHEWAELHDKILISTSSNNLPDVARCDIAWIPEFEEMDVLVPLDIEEEDFNSVSSLLLDSAMSTAKIEDHYYGLALNTNSKIMFYNTQMLTDAGVAVPTNMDEWEKVVKQIAGKNSKGQKIWGWNEPGLSAWNICPFIWSFGGALTNAEQTKASGYVNGPETVKAVKAFADLYKADALTGFNAGDIPMTDGFGTYRYAMMLEGPWKIAELQGSYPDVEYSTTQIPAGKGGSISVLGGEDIVMFKGSKQDAAWKFMKFMTGEFAEVEMAKCGQLPVNKTALQTPTVKNASFAPYLDAIKTAKARPTVASSSKIDNALMVAMNEVISGEKSAQVAMDDLAITIDALL